MADEVINTIQLNNWVDRMRGGDRAARDELLRSVCNRMERLARKMLQGFPRVHRWADTGDVMQNALMRLLRALEEVRPNSVRDFFGLAAEQMRRELLDLSRHFHGPRGMATHQDSIGGNERMECDAAAAEASPDELERWTAYHEAVAQLPVEEREVVGLVFYHGWTQAAVAELFGVSVRTVGRWWEAAMLKLSAVLKTD